MKKPANEEGNNTSIGRFTPFLRTLIEVGFIIFLFYSNLLMGEFLPSSKGRANGLIWAIKDIFTIPNFIIAIVAAYIGHFAFGYVRRKL
jgi:hypothetical protein